MALQAACFGKTGVVPKCFDSTYSLHCSDLVKADIPTVIPSRPLEEELFKHGILHFQLGKHLFKHPFATVEIQIPSKCVVESSHNLTSVVEISGGTLVSKF